MPQISSLTVRLSMPDTRPTLATIEERRWSKIDANGKALRWGGAVFVLGLMMLPIPIVHFGVIPLYLVGLPMTLVAVYKLYSSGTDIQGSAVCPNCQAPLELKRSSDDWPLSGLCPACKKNYLIEREGEAESLDY